MRKKELYEGWELIKAISENKIKEGTKFADDSKIFEYEIKKDSEGIWFIDFSGDGEAGISLFINNQFKEKK